MGSKTTVSLLLHVIILSITLSDAQYCYATGNFTANSTYAKNRDLVLRSLASNVTPNGGFYNTTIGSGNDTVYGLVHCLASPPAENCSSCVNYAIQTLMTGCPNQKEAISWGGNPFPCIVRYANRYFFGSLELSPTEALYNTGIIDASLTQFDQVWSGIRDNVTRASTNSSRLAAETTDLSSTQKIYCTPDVSQSNCGECLQRSVDDYKSCCYGQQGANSTYAKNRDLVLRSLASNVIANGGFYNTTIGLGNDTVYGLAHCMASPSAGNCSSCVSYAIQALMTACPNQKEAISWGGNPVPCIVRYANRYFFGSLERSPNDTPCNTGIIDASLTQFDQAWSGIRNIVTRANSTSSSRHMLAAETTDLSSTQKIYCTPDVSQSNCGECLQQSLDYYKSCCYGKQGAVVQKPNCFFRWDLNPYYNLFPKVTSPSPPFIGKENTTSRTVIVTTVPTAILLALVILILTIFRFRKPKQEVKRWPVSGHDNSEQMHYFSLKAISGYMAPEYALEGIISTKSDVYSFGILLLEIITGKKSRGFYSQDQAQSLLFHAWQLWNEGRGQELIDRNVVDSCPIGEALRWIHIALLCVQDDPARRPTMSLVVLMLGSNAVNLPQPSAGLNSLEN
ncbi:hypothetical protein SADUNF_Sadunf11G0016200 [Salix dunnii]|uniref:Gnk2-homologous domain-containing protein n=1 Tax=Salix dunnii TaxID=1413687 RepID=A0A835MMN1_9ROSI|nr:hypothetical protein SADUNF_Sadunf11G0016200 [Salix dunnii]